MKWFVKTPYKAKESCKNSNKALHHTSKEESPLTEITHEASHSISDLLKPSDQIAPTESSSWGDYAI